MIKIEVTREQAESLDRCLRTATAAVEGGLAEGNAYDGFKEDFEVTQKVAQRMLAGFGEDGS